MDVKCCARAGVQSKGVIDRPTWYLVKGPCDPDPGDFQCVSLLRFSFGQNGEPFISLLDNCLDARQFPEVMDKVLFRFFRGDVKFLDHLVSNLDSFCCSIQQFPDASSRFIQGVDAFQVAHSLADRNKDAFITDFSEDDGITFFEYSFKKIHKPVTLFALGFVSSRPPSSCPAKSPPCGGQHGRKLTGQAVPAKGKETEMETRERKLRADHKGYV